MIHLMNKSSGQIYMGSMDDETAIEVLENMLGAMDTYDGISPTPSRINAIKISIEALKERMKK